MISIKMRCVFGGMCLVLFIYCLHLHLITLLYPIPDCLHVYKQPCLHFSFCQIVCFCLVEINIIFLDYLLFAAFFGQELPVYDLKVLLYCKVKTRATIK